MDNNKGNSTVIILLSITSVLLLAGISYLFGQNRQVKQKLMEDVVGENIKRMEEDMKEEKKESPITITEKMNTIVYEKEKDFPLADKNQINLRVIEPFIFYYQDLQDENYLSIASVYINQKESKISFPYGVNYIFTDGVNGGFLISQKDGQIDWWYPECLNECNLSEEFTEKYPEIADKVSQ